MFMMPNEGSLSFFSKFMTRSNLGTQLLIAACIVWSFILGSGFAYVVRQYSSHSDEDDGEPERKKSIAVPSVLGARFSKRDLQLPTFRKSYRRQASIKLNEAKTSVNVNDGALLTPHVDSASQATSKT
eukprot:GEMP01070559.1.p1 GENE.GEMP01070559.1~~GEMP01070559.1.p1  ORF type:complete len:128 (+),score=18.12 GEMP01070559.1:301-684(+)